MTLHSLIRNLKWRFGKYFYSPKRQKWQNVLFANEDFKNGKSVPLEEYTTEAPIVEHKNKRVVCIYDGKIKNGGLADRLRGIISVYEVCKELGLEFKLIFNSPFELQLFLEPNEIDWRISKEELNYNTKVTDICDIETFADSEYEAKRQREWFRKEFKKNYREFHIRTNAFFSYKGNYSGLFHELFKISPRLQASIDIEKRKLGNRYISTSFRFMNLLGDFNETVERGIRLSNREKDELIEKNLRQLELLHKNSDSVILVNSDSTTFLQRAVDLNYTYIIPGNVTHIDGNTSGDRYEAFEKTFLDFFMIANAEKIYLMRTGDMYNSGYPYAASFIYNKPFEKIEF